MAKEINNAVEILDGDFSNVEELLSQGKTVLLAVEIGEYISVSLEKGFSNYLNSKIELKEKNKNAGICGCGKPADALIYAWRD